MVATAKRKAERAKALAEGKAKSTKQKAKNAAKDHNSKPTGSSKPKKSTPESAQRQDKPEDANMKSEQQEKKHRYIVFIGNLPYTATTAQLEAHFTGVKPSQIRHSTDRSTGKSKGFAFLEFDDYARMEMCIRLFHHTLFGAAAGSEAKEQGEAEDDSGEAGRTRKSMGEKNAGGRRINVELTVGGGGSKSAARRAKLKAKNEKLGEERLKRVMNEKAAAGKGKKTKALEGENMAEEKSNAKEDEENHIHPSRMSKVTR